MPKIDKRILSYYTKDELIDCILHTPWMFSPMTSLLDSMKLKTNIENEEILNETEKLVKKMKGRQLQEQHEISIEIDKLYKKLDKNYMRIEKMTNMIFELEGIGGKDD